MFPCVICRYATDEIDLDALHNETHHEYALMFKRIWVNQRPRTLLEYYMFTVFHLNLDVDQENLDVLTLLYRFIRFYELF